MWLYGSALYFSLWSVKKSELDFHLAENEYIPTHICLLIIFKKLQNGCLKLVLQTFELNADQWYKLKSLDPKMVDINEWCSCDAVFFPPWYLWIEVSIISHHILIYSVFYSLLARPGSCVGRAPLGSTLRTSGGSMGFPRYRLKWEEEQT